jgi:hypothetical protein
MVIRFICARINSLIMWGSLISSIWGGITAIGAGHNAGMKRKEIEDTLGSMRGENQAWYDANALSDYTQRADAQNLMRQLREGLKKRTKAAQQSAVVTGATVEQQAVEKEATNKAISDTFANIGSMGQQWKDNITNRYLARKQQLDGLHMGLMDKEATSWENLMQTGLNTMGGSAGGMLNGIK